ncbi:TIGR04222 domain-containing membrane protein [Nonomuraea deserti]|uniref:TIGR04222 domain-containing membrane protein n=1 Tax=Nonomuraea deserti TaxID=1848322 RepID=A0A4R4UI55_9ACTN|nr:TIGR04222 domain-containing membrane protein [Nonomuraea deserti]TDC91557.1 TIGR04222 domain-containing membrane protein [Nonomuraea deserti]
MDYVLIIVSIAVVVLVNAAEQRVERERRRVSGTASAGGGHQLGPYELAYLSGGPRRALNTALAVLASAGAVRVSRGSRVTAVYGASPSPEPLEQAVLDALASRPGGHQAGELRRELETRPALTELAAGLERKGLIVPESAFATARRRCGLLRLAVCGAAGYLVLVVVLAVAGVAGKESVYIGAVFFSLFAVATGLIGLYRQKRRLRNVVTGEGRQVLRSAHAYHPRGVHDPRSLSLAVGIPVALYGLSESGDQLLCDELSAGVPGGDCAGSCGTYSGSDGITFGSGDSFGGLDFGGGSSSCGGGSSSCGGGGSSCGGGGSS